MIVPAHLFNVQVVIRRVTSTTNVKGQDKPVYSDYATLWARRQFREESRKTVDGVEQIEQRPVFTVRKYDILKTDLLVDGSDLYRIDSAIPSDNDLYTIIRAYINDKN